MADPLSGVMGAIVARLDANATLIGLGVTGCYEGFIPANTATPFIELRFLSGGDSPTAAGHRDVRYRLLILGVGATPDQARAVCDAMDTELHKTELSIAGWSNYRCRADDDYVQVEQFQGKQVYLRGKIFGIWLDKS